MTTVYPIGSVPQQPTGPAAKSNDFGQDTFLKLLVAEMKYQDPMSPVDSTEFLSQSAEFTTLETLQRMAKSQEVQSEASMVLSATAMVGRAVTYSVGPGGQSAAPTPTSIVSMRGTLPKDAEVGTRMSTNATVFTKEGKSVEITLDFVKSEKGWTVQAKHNGKGLGDPQPLTFDKIGDRTGGDINIPAAALEGVAGQSGKWPATGITLTFGDPNDPTRLHLADGPGTVMVAEQNGNDGNTATGIVTGIHLTADGPMLLIGGREIPLASVLGVLA